MKPSELTAKLFLEKHFSKIEYEPIRGQAPDFLCNAEIAIEVRLLDQAVVVDGRSEGLMSGGIPLARTLQKIYSEFHQDDTSRQWFVHHTFSRPIPCKKTVAASVRKCLNDFLNTPEKAKETSFQIQNLKITVVPSSSSGPNPFVLGGWVDGDSGGWIESELIENISRCTIEKAAKIQSNKTKFPKWWLLLVDEIGLAQTKPDMASKEEYLRARSEFETVILLSPDQDCSSLVL